MKRPMLYGLLAGSILLVSACGTTSVPVPRSPDQALYEATVAYAGMLKVVVSYGHLPLCPGDTWALTCHNGGLLTLAQTTSNGVAAGLEAARPLVDAYGAIVAPTSTDTAKITAAVEAVTQTVGALKILADQIGKLNT